MKRYKITMDVFIDEDRIDSLLDSLYDTCVSNCAEQYIISSRTSQNMNNKKGRFKAGYLFRIRNNKIKRYSHLLITKVGSTMIQFCLINKKLFKENNLDNIEGCIDGYLYGRYNKEKDTIEVNEMIYYGILTEAEYRRKNRVLDDDIQFIPIENLNFLGTISQSKLINIIIHVN